MSLVCKVRETVVSHSMISKGDKVIACLSGGADSVCLLIALQALKEELGISLSAVHVNHCLRGEESDRDMRFCSMICEKNGIPLQIFFADVKKHALENGLSTEEAARKLRYEAFDKASENLSGAKLATAHNKCDNSETVLFNIARGTGIKGICGIPYVRGNVIRPLLDAAREEIEDFLRSEGINYVTDSSNLTDDYSRNRIRHRVIPELEKINSGFFEAVSRLSKSAEEDEEYFSALIEKIPDEKICGYPPSVRKRYIRKILSHNGISCSYDRLNLLDSIMASGKNTRYELSGNTYAYFSDGTMEIKKGFTFEKIPFSCQVKIHKDIAVSIPEYDKTVKIESLQDDFFTEKSNVQKKLTNEYLNYDKIQGVVTLRNKRDGDTVGLVGRDFDTRLKKLFNSLKLSDRERQTALVMEDGAGIIWSEYGGVSRRVHAACGDAHIIKVSVIKRKTV